MTDPGHKDTWGAPSTGWPQFDPKTGKRLPAKPSPFDPEPEAYWQSVRDAEEDADPQPPSEPEDRA